MYDTLIILLRYCDHIKLFGSHPVNIPDPLSILNRFEVKSDICSKLLKENLNFPPVLQETEGSQRKTAAAARLGGICSAVA